MLAYRKIMFWASVWDSGLQQTHEQIFGESQFDNASFLSGLLLTYAGLQKILLWESVWNSGFLWMHIQIGANFIFDPMFFIECGILDAPTNIGFSQRQEMSQIGLLSQFARL